MENFNFYAPTYFAFGKSKESETGRLVEKFGGKKVLLHYGKGSAVKSGLIDRVKTSLEEKKKLNKKQIKKIETLITLVNDNIKVVILIKLNKILSINENKFEDLLTFSFFVIFEKSFCCMCL